GWCAGGPANSLQMLAGAASENRVGVRVAVYGAARMRRRLEVRLLGFGGGGRAHPAALGLGGDGRGLARRGFLVFGFLGEAKGAQPAGLGRLRLARAVGWRGEFRFAVHRCIRSATFGFARLTRNLPSIQGIDEDYCHGLQPGKQMKARKSSAETSGMTW